MHRYSAAPVEAAIDAVTLAIQVTIDALPLVVEARVRG
jgi:hypothetical protein